MKNILGGISILAALLGAPFLCFAGVKINEIAWMGTEKSSYGEWIELYNNGDIEVDLNGAGLYEEGGKTLIISLTKKIGAKSYYLIERVTPSTPDPIPEIADDMGSFGGSGLKNLPGGEYLVLKSSAGIIIDYIDAITGWPAGESDTKNGVRTMQLSGDSWITATATPKAINTTISIDTENSTTTETVLDDSSGSDQTETISYSSHSSSAEISQPVEKIKVSLTSGRNRISLSGSPVLFSGKFADGSGKTLFGGSFNWAFGDGTSASGQQVSHVYDLPGEYIVILNASYEGDEYVGRSIVKIVKPNFEIKQEGGILSIKNKLLSEVNLKGWKVFDDNKTFIFQADTIILADKTNAFSSKILGFDVFDGDKIELISPDNKTISIYQRPPLINEILTRGGDCLSRSEPCPDTKMENGVELFAPAYDPVELSVFTDDPVDNSGDNLGTDKLKLELATLEGKLKELQNLLAVDVSIPKKEKILDEKIILNKNVKILDKAEMQVKGTTSEVTIIRLEPQKKEFAVWTFFKSLLYR